MIDMVTRHWPFGFLILVGITNIVLNSWVNRAASKADTYGAALLSKDFGIAFLVGTLSILCLLLAYKHWSNLGSGLLLMGATSIVGGTLWGVLGKGNKLTISEWGLFCCIAVFYLYRGFSPLIGKLSR